MDIFDAAGLKKPKISSLRKEAESRINNVQVQQKQARTPAISKEMLGDIAKRYERVMANSDFETREKLSNLLINRVVLYPDTARVEGNIPITNDALSTPGFSPQDTKRRISFSFEIVLRQNQY